ncbi:MAG: DUF3592 domain-containing protein [Proteobacteria bacterium]|nr:DUF3592 domain-containing protein [Pseudomonadota bacterium]
MPDLPWFVYAMLLAPFGVIVIAAAYKTLQVRAASDWPSVEGRVVTSAAQMRSVRVIDGDRASGRSHEQRNFANVVYEYSVAGVSFRNNRVSIGEDLGNFEVAETLAKYPAGKAVTVYYNPLHPKDAVLERDAPKGMWGCIGIAGAILLAVVFGSAFGLHQITEMVSRGIPNAEMSGAVVAFSAFGVVVALFALMMQWQASVAKAWPVVPGKVTMSDVDAFRGASNVGEPRAGMMYRARLTYSYEYNGIPYIGHDVSLGGKLTSSSQWLAKHTAAKYREGTSVKVYVNPQKAEQAVLNPRVGGAWLLWLIVIAVWGVAYYAAIK